MAFTWVNELVFNRTVTLSHIATPKDQTSRPMNASTYTKNHSGVCMSDELPQNGNLFMAENPENIATCDRGRGIRIKRTRLALATE